METSHLVFLFLNTTYKNLVMTGKWFIALFYSTWVAIEHGHFWLIYLLNIVILKKKSSASGSRGSMMDIDPYIFIYSHYINDLYIAYIYIFPSITYIYIYIFLLMTCDGIYIYIGYWWNSGDLHSTRLNPLGFFFFRWDWCLSKYYNYMVNIWLIYG